MLGNFMRGFHEGDATFHEVFSGGQNFYCFLSMRGIFRGVTFSFQGFQCFEGGVFC